MFGRLARLLGRTAKFAGTPEENIDRFRQQIAADDARAASAMADAYERAFRRAARDLQSILDQIDRNQAAGLPLHPNWLWRQQRYHAMIQKLESAYRDFAEKAHGEVDKLVRTSALLGLRSSASMMATRAAGDKLLEDAFTMLPASAVESIVGSFRRDAPLNALFRQIGPDAPNAARDALVAGIANGDNGRTIGRAVKAAVEDVSLRRARLIGVTESQRARTKAQIDNYRANSDVVIGWRWIAALSLQTCPACLARHGHVYPVSVPFSSHPGCRCTPVPVLDHDEDYGPTSKAWFDEQTTADQRRILGPGKLKLYTEGKVGFDALAVATHNPIWGPGLKTITIRDIHAGMGMAHSAAPIAPPPTRAAAVRRQDRLLVAAEAKIATLTDHEEAYIFTADGQIVHRIGEKSSVTYTDADVPMLKNSVMTHNHPLVWSMPEGDPMRELGNSFSPADIVFSAHHDLKQIRAVSGDVLFVADRPEGGWPDYRDLHMAIEYADLDVSDEFRAKIKNGDLTVPMAQAMHFHEIMSRVLPKWGIGYTRTKRTEPRGRKKTSP